MVKAELSISKELKDILKDPYATSEELEDKLKGSIKNTKNY